MDPDVIRGGERATGETFNPGTGQWMMRDGYDRLEVLDRIEVLIARGTVIDGAVVALCPGPDGVIADVCIDGPPVP